MCLLVNRCFFVFFSVYSLLVPYPKLLQVKNDAVNIVKKMRRSCQDAFFFFFFNCYGLKIDAALFSG